MDRHLARRTLLQRADRHQLRGDDARRLVVFLELATDEQHRVGVDQRGVLRKRLREDDDLDAAADVVEHEHGHAVSLLRLQGTQAAHDAADPDVGFRCGEFRDAPCAERPEFVAEALERMAAHVQAERFLLERELLRFGPWRRVGQRNHPGACVVVSAAEQ